MTALPFADGAFDVVVHSDTLEHVPRPVRGLAECRRVLRPGGFCAFTVPMVVGRLTVSREGLPPSYHGSPSNPADCLVHTEYGADAWGHVVRAGFAECRLFALEHPAAHALVGVA
jgi:SAM-dependent methyltransferase